MHEIGHRHTDYRAEQVSIQIQNTLLSVAIVTVQLVRSEGKRETSCALNSVASFTSDHWQEKTEKKKRRRLGFSSLVDGRSKAASVHTYTPSFNYLLTVMRERWSVSHAKKYHTACEILRETSYLGLHFFTVCVLLQ